MHAMTGAVPAVQVDCPPPRLLTQDDESDEDREQPAAAELDGLKVAHDAEGLDAGETVILTLKDRNILEEGDDDPEELEDVLAVRLCCWKPAT